MSSVFSYLQTHHGAIDTISARITSLDTTDLERIAEISDAADSLEPKAFDGWLKGQRPDLQAFYHAIYLPLVDPLQLDPEVRKQKIERWLSVSGHGAAGPIIDALKGKSGLESLSLPEQLYLIHLAITPGKTYIGFDDVVKLALRVQRDAALRLVVAEGLLDFAIELMSRPESDADHPHLLAQDFALQAISAMDLDEENRLGQLIAGKKSAAEASLVAHALGGEDPPKSHRRSEARSRLLSALNGVPSTDATIAAVGTLYALTSPKDIYHTPRLASDFARALARESFPGPADAGKAVVEGIRLSRLFSREPEFLFGGWLDRKVTTLTAVRAEPGLTADALSSFDGDQMKNPVVAAAMARQLVPVDIADRAKTIERFAKILQEDQGQQLVFGTRRGQLEDNVPVDARKAALAVIINHPDITAKTLRQTEDPWMNRAIVEPIAQQLMAEYRNDEPRVLFGSTLDTMIGKALNLPDQLPAGVDEDQALATLDDDRLSVYAPGHDPVSKSDYECIKKIREQIQRIGGLYPSVTIVPVVFCGMERGPRPRGPLPGGPIRLALFRVRTADGDKFVDNQGFKYDSFDDWLKGRNRLPPGLVMAPQNGHLQAVHNHMNAGQDETLILASAINSSETAGEVVDSLALVGGMVAGGLVVLGTGGLAAIAVAGTTAWGAYRSGGELVFNYTHGDPLSRSELRGLWLGFVANATGVAPVGAELALARYIAQGSRLGRGLALTIGVLGAGATITNAAATVNSAWELFENLEFMTLEQRISNVADMAYTALITGVGARHAIKYFHPATQAAAVLARSREARLVRLDGQLNALHGQLKAAPPDRIAEINKRINETQTAIDSARRTSPAERKLLSRLVPLQPAAQKAAPFDPDNFWPNPEAPNGPALSKHDRIAKAIGGLVARARVLGKRLPQDVDPVETYKKLYDEASPEHRVFLPEPGSFKVDDNTVALAELVSGLAGVIADIHAHPYGYDRRSPWNDLLLGIRHGTDALVNLLKVADKNALVAIEAIAQSCGSPGGYYADANPTALTTKQAAELDRRVAEVYLAVYGAGAEGQALAAKGYVSMTGLDFSEKTGAVERYRAATKAYHDAVAELANPDDRKKMVNTIHACLAEVEDAFDERARQRQLGVVSPETYARYQAAGQALREASSKRIREYPDLYERAPMSVRRALALQKEAAQAVLELRAYEAEDSARSEDPIAHTQNMWKRYPGVFSLIGEITANKELVGQALGAGKWDISNPKFKRWLDFLVAQKVKAPIVLHSDWGHAGLDEAGRAAAVHTAYENVPEIVQVFGQEKYRDLNVIFAHTGIGRYVRPNAALVEVSVIDRATGQRVTRHVPEHIAMIYQIAEKVPNAKFDISWNDVAQAYADNASLRTALVDFIIDNQDRILFGSDTVKPVNSGHYHQALYTAAPIFTEIARRDPEALWKLLRGNSEKLLNGGAASVADWTRKNLSDATALAAMDERNKVLAEHRATMLKGARADFDRWVAKFKAQGAPKPSDNPGFFPAFFMSHPDAHDHDPPLEGANPDYGPIGRGTPGGYVNEPPDMNPTAKKAARDNKVAAVTITAGASVAGAVATGHIGDHSDALAFMGRGAAITIRALYTERLRLEWEQIFEEGHVTRKDIYNNFVNRIINAAGPLKLTPDKIVKIIGATEQLLANYAYLAQQPLESYNSIGGTIEEAKAARFHAIMAKVGEYQVAVDRILGVQASSINPFDARTTVGKAYRVGMLATYLVNDVAAAEWLAGGHVDLSTPEGKAQAAYHILFALGNGGKTIESILGLSGGLSGRNIESDPLFKNALQKYSNWALGLGGAAWSTTDIMNAYSQALAGGLTGQTGLDTAKVMLDLAFTYGVYRISGFDAKKAAGDPTPHGRNLAWASAVVGGALVLRELIREWEAANKKQSRPNVAPAAAPAVVPQVVPAAVP
jgi:hypothetical protein